MHYAIEIAWACQRPRMKGDPFTGGVMALDTGPLARAIENLLSNCARLKPGMRLVIVRENEGAGYYDDHIAATVARAASDAGIGTTLCTVPFQKTVDGLNGELADMMSGADCTLFFARLGDQVRFRTLPTGTKAVVSYALDLASLGSAFGTAHYGAFTALKEAIDDMIADAGEIRVTCPRGTDFAGPGPGGRDKPKEDVTVIRFPMSVFAPVPAAGFSGRAALAGFLMGTGSRYYEPYGRSLAGNLVAHFNHGRLSGFSGAPADVATANEHYDDIAARFGIDRNAVHSWHAGIHPGCGFHVPVEHDFLRWSGGAFGNPRILHFHTCGAYAPGEISWNILDPTIRVDGVAVWEDGRLHPERVLHGAEILDRYPCAAAIFAHPERAVGIDDVEQA